MDWYRYYSVWLLCAVYLCNQVDRQIFAILQHPIQREFQFSDMQLGLIGGTAFAIFYAALSIPIARFADRSNRVNIVSASLALWSLFTALTGYAQSFVHLLIARAIVGVGEAGCSPPSYSIISDYFEPRRRSTAFSIFSLGLPGGTIVGLLVTTAVAEAYGWRTAFLVMGLPGLVLAILVKLTLREPPRGAADEATSMQQQSLREFFASLWAKGTFRYLIVAATIYSVTANGVGAFYSLFLIRCHGFTLSDTGQWLVIASIVGGLPGTFFGGKLADLLTNRTGDVRWQLRIPALALSANIPIGLLLYTATDKATIIGLLTVNIALSAVHLAPTVATLQRLVSFRSRALVTAILFFVMNLIGIGLGPLLTGQLSDLLKSHFMNNGGLAGQAAADGLRFAFICMLSLPVVAVACYLRSTRTLRNELVS
jgi:predicted MFS family arabinose efflux permease